jgi:hypothetical protein
MSHNKVTAVKLQSLNRQCQQPAACDDLRPTTLLVREPLVPDIMQQSAEQQPEHEETLAMKPPADFSRSWAFASQRAHCRRSKAWRANYEWEFTYGQVSKSHDKVTAVKFHSSNRQCRLKRHGKKEALIVPSFA